MAQHTVPANELAIKALRCPEGKSRLVYTDFTVVPWSRRLEQFRSREIAGVVATNEPMMIGRTRERRGPQR